MFSLLRFNCKGVQFARYFRALVYLLHEWSKYKGRRAPLCEVEDKKDKQADAKLRVIYFDKLAMFLFRIWDKLHEANRSEILEILEDSKPVDISNLVTFRPPLHEIPGKHGSGPGRRRVNRKPIFLIEILWDLQRDHLLHYFEIKPPQNDPDNPQNHKTTVAHAIPIPDADKFLNGFTQCEINILKDLANCLKRLGPGEIRALGTHQNNQKTCADTKREFEYIERDKHRLKVINCLRSNNCFFEDAKEMLEYADEAYRKSKGNIDDYKNAHETMSSEIADIKLQTAFNKCQFSSEHIWGTNDMEKLAQKSEKMLYFCRYLYALAYYRKNPAHRKYLETNGRRLPKGVGKYYYHYHEGIKGMEKCGIIRFPISINSVFKENRTEIIVPKYHDLLIETLESLYFQ